MIEAIVVAIVRLERDDKLQGYVFPVREEIRKKRYQLDENCFKLRYTNDCEELSRIRFECGELVADARRMLKDDEFIVIDAVRDEIVLILRLQK